MTAREGKFVLPGTKKITLNQSRGLDIKVLNDQISALILEVDKEGPRKILLKVKAEASHETNFKSLSGFDVNEVRETLSALGGDLEGLAKDGVCYNILVEIQKRMPHVCYGCENIIYFENNLRNTQKCISCHNQLCRNCNKGSKFQSVCQPCGVWIKD